MALVIFTARLLPSAFLPTGDEFMVRTWLPNIYDSEQE